MNPNLLMTIILPLLIFCKLNNVNHEIQTSRSDTAFHFSPHEVLVEKIENIPLPPGYRRIHFDKKSFAVWLRAITIKKDKRVFLYNGELKRNQSAQFVVLDIPVGNKDLQQCADAVMRLRAQYLLDQKRYNEISFADNNKRSYAFSSFPGISWEQYLEKVYSFCGTLSLEKQLKKVNDFNKMEPGDVLIKGGSPGHAVVIVDMVINQQGKRLYLLAQSYMPAQDIHVLKNPMDVDLNPWYELNDKTLINTPEWVFQTQHLRRW